jgi:hypothetical protein
MAYYRYRPHKERYIPFDLAPLIALGTTLTSVEGFASRRVTATTTLAGSVAAEDGSVLLSHDPGMGALLVVDPDDPRLKETFRVHTVIPSGPNFLCTLVHTAERPHAISATVNYGPGVSPTFLVDSTPTPVGTIAHFEIGEGEDGQVYHLSILGACDNGDIVEVDLDVVYDTSPE